MEDTQCAQIQDSAAALIAKAEGYRAEGRFEEARSACIEARYMLVNLSSHLAATAAEETATSADRNAESPAAVKLAVVAVQLCRCEWTLGATCQCLQQGKTALMHYEAALEALQLPVPLEALPQEAQAAAAKLKQACLTSLANFFSGPCDDARKATSYRTALMELLKDMEREMDGGACCSICLDELTPRVWVMPCGHFFHVDCLSRWLQEESQTVAREASCPDCRSPCDPLGIPTGPWSGPMVMSDGEYDIPEYTSIYGSADSGSGYTPYTDPVASSYQPSAYRSQYACQEYVIPEYNPSTQ